MVLLFKNVVSPCSGAGTFGVASLAASVSGSGAAGAVGGSVIQGIQENVIPSLGNDVTEGIGQVKKTPG